MSNLLAPTHLLSAFAAPQMQDAVPGKPHYERFAISMPAAMAETIRQLCESESRSHSEFFREAVRAYLSQRQPAYPGALAQGSAGTESKAAVRAPTLSAVREKRSAAPAGDDTFADFSEWASDQEYDALVEHPSLDLWDQKQA